MLHRILEILNAKIAMGAGYGEGVRHRRHHKRLMASGEGEGEGYRRRHTRRAGVTAGEGRRKRHHTNAGVYAGEGRRMRHHSRRHSAGVYAGEGRKRHTRRRGGAVHETAWVAHVKDYADRHGISYKDALSRARASYHH